jgi:DUF4097 and DUF4098 domain-containing protein YvlB
MKYILLFLFFAFRINIAISQSYLNKTADLIKYLPDVSTVEAKTEGSILLIGEPIPKTRVEVYLSSGNAGEVLSGNELVQRLKDGYDLTISVTNGKLVAIAERKKGVDISHSTLNISFKIVVPENISSALSNKDGDIDLKNLHGGKHTISANSGNIGLDSVIGTVKGRTLSGDVRLYSVRDSINVTTNSGNIDAKYCKGYIRLITLAGNIRLDSLKGIVLSMTTNGSVSGNHIEGDLASNASSGNIILSGLSCSLKASVSGGNIDVKMTTAGRPVIIRNSSGTTGNIKLEIPVNAGYDLKLAAGKVERNKLPDDSFKGTEAGDKVTGKWKGGGTSVDAEGRGTLVFSFSS